MTKKADSASKAPKAADKATSKAPKASETASKGPEQGAENADQGTQKADPSPENAPENGDQGGENPDSGTENPDSAPAESADVEPETVHVALLPVKLRQYRHVLERPYVLTKGASNLVAGGEVHAVKSIDYNPHTRRQEIVLAEKTLFEDSELAQLLTKGWAQTRA
jgi:hypothetical protein